MSYVSEIQDGESRGRTHHRRRWLVFAWLFIGLHVISVLALPKHAEPVSYIFLVCAPWVAAVAALRAGIRASNFVRTSWLLIAGALAIWSGGMMLAAWSDLVEGASPLYANAADFAYFIYGAPVLAAVSLPDNGDEIRRGILFDLFQAALCGLLTYVAIFNAFPFSHESAKPVPTALIISTYNIENAALAIVASLRLLARSAEPGRRSSDLTIFLFLVLYAICAGGYNYICLKVTFDAGPQDALVDLPFLFLAVRARFGVRTRFASAARAAFVGVFVDGASPVLLTAALLSLATFVAQRHHLFGGIAIVLTLLSYGGEAALMQTRYLQMQAVLRDARDRLERLSLEDGLTGIANRRSFDLALDEAWHDTRRHSWHLALLLMDIDHFKRLNDTHGHSLGDRCLVHVAATMKSALHRNTDFICRYGGEEFAILLPNSNCIEAETIARRVLEMVRSRPMLDDSGTPYPVTISVGIAVTRDGIADANGLVEAADRALYRAKRNGRDRIEPCAEIV